MQYKRLTNNIYNITFAISFGIWVEVVDVLLLVNVTIFQNSDKTICIFG